jgi:hypothetical protein
LDFYPEPPRGSGFFLFPVAVGNLPKSQGRRQPVVYPGSSGGKDLNHDKGLHLQEMDKKWHKNHLGVYAIDTISARSLQLG